MKIKFFTTGGTIDKVYNAETATLDIGDPVINHVLLQTNVKVSYEIESLLYKDSLEITEQDVESICKKVNEDIHKYIIITHGTDTMIQTAQALSINAHAEMKNIGSKVIVFTGAMNPNSLKNSDALLNIGSSLSAVQLLKEGVYIVLNGKIFDPFHVRKNHKLVCFEDI